MSAVVWAAVSGLGVGSGLLAVAGAWRGRRPDLAARAAQGMPGRRRGGIAQEMTRFLRRRLLVVAEALGSTTESVERRLVLLGRPGTIGSFRLQQFASAVVGMVLAVAVVTVAGTARFTGTFLLPPLMVVGGLIGAALWDQALGVRARTRQKLLDAQVPDASELIALSIGAGESVPGALSRVSNASVSSLATELEATANDIRLGRPASRALHELAARNDSPSLDRLCLTLVTAIERGTPLAGVLHDQARDIREASRQRLMEEGGRREIAMLFPVVFLILPVTVLFALYPGLISLGIGP
ncbi:MAG: type II secretion system F family protein [Pauljensenia sp.]